MNEVLAILLANLDEAYDKKGWHGTGLRGSVRGLKVEEVLRRPGKGRHNIWELTAHAAYWKYAVRRRLAGGIKRGSFVMKGSNWFPSPPRPTEETWHDLVLLLDSEHRQLRDAIASIDLRDRQKVRLAYGIAAHDLYHAGQIQLVKRLASR